MGIVLTRRSATLAMLAVSFAPFPVMGQTAEVWSADMAADALQQDLIRMIDVRSRPEWTDTGVAGDAWPISLHEDRFAERLFAARERAEGRPVALICATGGRSGRVMRSLRQAGYSGFLDVSEGMLGSAAGPGWIAGGYPVVGVDAALAALPEELS
ncbi:sulfurtransferase [Tritonibacter mobilis]|uniref:Rhodanese domain-containing protein n=3 Tax=Paracoccaceae TaxID=31989 RepID=A0A132BZ19_9RHOB|nr:sulfurtransferase [Tritonibacter mobilis F1926]KJZ22793.1 sulfurtransferase [Tritonibacter mobilis]KUP93613.1 hypothetical protein TRIHO_14600 [Tritonibacter horizontis]